MDSLLLPIILLVIMGVFGAIFIVVTKKQERLETSKKAAKGNNNANTKKTDVKEEDVFRFMEFDRILDDMIVQKNGSRYTMAIKCKGINYDLMSEVEQLAVEEGFITFLNTLRYPIQLYVQAQNIDLKSVIAEYRNNIVGIKNDFDRLDKEYNKVVEAFDSTREEIDTIEKERNRVLNVYEYASDIISYVERMSTNKSLLQRNFYVLVSYNVSEITAADTFTKEEIINIVYTELLTRCQSIISALAACSVDGKVLGSNEVADLLYTAYNRDDKGVMSVREAIESGFYRLYSTSEDAFYKKTELLRKEIDEEARLRSLEALQYVIDKGNYIPRKQEQLETIEEISRQANDRIAREDAPQEIKQKAQEVILNDYKVMKKQLLQEIEEEKINVLAAVKELDEHPERKKTIAENPVSNTEGGDMLQDPVEGPVINAIPNTNTQETISNDMNTSTNNNLIEEDRNNIPKNVILGEDQETDVISSPEPSQRDSIFFDDRLDDKSDDSEEDESII